MSPSMSVSSNAERLMGRISAGRAHSAALSECVDDIDHTPKVGLPSSCHPYSAPSHPLHPLDLHCCLELLHFS